MQALGFARHWDFQSKDVASDFLVPNESKRASIFD
jgi:hypothetical protein